MPREFLFLLDRIALSIQHDVVDGKDCSLLWQVTMPEPNRLITLSLVFYSRACLPGRWNLSVRLGVLLASSMFPAVSARAQSVFIPEGGVSATFSIVAVDPDSGTCGAAVASKYPAVGKVVPYVRAGVGAFCTQHWHNPAWGERALDLLESGKGPEEVLGILLQDDERRDKRQLAIIDMRGRAANRNPADADPGGVYWGAMSGRYYACQGNTLTGRGVVVAMAQAYEETQGSLTDRLMAALVAGDCAGGDHRGKLAAGIRVAKAGQNGHWFELYVDDSDNAVIDLLSKYAAADHPAKGSWNAAQLLSSPCTD